MQASETEEQIIINARDAPLQVLEVIPSTYSIQDREAGIRQVLNKPRIKSFEQLSAALNKKFSQSGRYSFEIYVSKASDPRRELDRCSKTSDVWAYTNGNGNFQLGNLVLYCVDSYDYFNG